MFLFKVTYPARTRNYPYLYPVLAPENGSDYYQCTLHKAEVSKTDINVVLKVNRIGLVADKWQGMRCQVIKLINETRFHQYDGWSFFKVLIVLF